MSRNTAAAAHIERIIARYALSRRDVLYIIVFAYRPDGMSLVRGIFDYVRGVGPAAQAAGRAGVHTHPAPRPSAAGMAAASRGDGDADAEMAMPRAA